MPEGLEAEIWRTSISARQWAVGSWTRGSTIVWPRPASSRRSSARGVTGVRRVGKVVVVETSGASIGLHFGMTGRIVVDGRSSIEQLEYSSGRDEPSWDRLPDLHRSPRRSSACDSNERSASIRSHQPRPGSRTPRGRHLRRDRGPPRTAAWLVDTSRSRRHSSTRPSSPASAICVSTRCCGGPESTRGAQPTASMQPRSATWPRPFDDVCRSCFAEEEARPARSIHNSGGRSGRALATEANSCGRSSAGERRCGASDISVEPVPTWHNRGAVSERFATVDGLTRSVEQLAAGDPRATRVIYAIVIALIVVGVVLVVLAIWMIRRTRADPELLGPLERMSESKWRKSGPEARRALLDEVRPAGAAAADVAAAR